MRAPEYQLIDKLEKLKNELEKSSNQLTENLVRAIKTAQDKLRSIISEKNYPEMMTQTIKDIVAQQTRLLAQIEEQSNLLTTRPRGLNNMMIQEMIQYLVIEIINNAQQNIEKYESLKIAFVRTNFEFLGTDSALSSVVATSGISTQELGVRSREESRFGVINKIANDLIAEVNLLQVSASESESDFDLKNYLRNLKDEMHPLNQTIKMFENTMKFSAIVQKIHAEAQLSLAQLQASQSAVSTTSTTTAPASSLFGSSNRSPNANRESRNPGCAQQ